ncbi:MAG: dipeptidase [Cohaesibacteraceae bacterium]|nr:dipeptidase [Cohaesibacteraceae bacterium]
MSEFAFPVFDGHNDTLLRLAMQAGTPREISFFEEAKTGHIDLPRAKRAGFAGGFFAMFSPSVVNRSNKAHDYSDPAHFAQIGPDQALPFTLNMMRRAFDLEKNSNGEVIIARKASDIRTAIGQKKLSILLHIEGAECIDKDLNALHVLFAAGLRSIGPVWSRQTIFASGVPMGFPMSPDTGPGMTDVGIELVKTCNALGVMLDMSHLNEKGFWDMHKHSDSPLVATHSNVHAICPSARNLTDKQLDAIAETSGVVGINFHVGFLREDGKRDTNTSLDVMLRHADYLLEKLGEDGVALGSDFDGCMVPDAIGDVTGVIPLLEHFKQAGYGDSLIRKIACDNWVNLLERTQAGKIASQ